ncbi:hypothetical protein H5P28_08925 [Ruficoccus amylovorans]|uniref:Beta-ketoacyl synthase N-terminal domain-containing protein n=1 Tax=Ruficoccus amylovorans TaxID=1804625 RepID=A0A842HEB4_9BACT|nr:hypothetical protein [Ruficoccus amylovorans]
MIKRFITRLAVAEPGRELDPERRKALRKNFGPLAARRMSDLSLLIGEVTDGLEAGADDEWIYASRFGGTQSLERYLASFPAPSPLHFQNSIHPGALDLVSVARRQSSALFSPLCGLETLVADALLAALIAPPETPVHLVGGDEYEHWCTAHSWGGEETFAFYLRLDSAAQEQVLGEVIFTPGEELANAPTAPTLPEFHAALAERRPLAFFTPERGTFRLSWA